MPFLYRYIIFLLSEALLYFPQNLLVFANGLHRCSVFPMLCFTRHHVPLVCKERFALYLTGLSAGVSARSPTTILGSETGSKIGGF